MSLSIQPLDQALPNVSKWTVEDVSRWFLTLDLSHDYSHKLQEMSMNGQALLHSSGNVSSLLNTLAADTHDRNTVSHALSRLIHHWTTPTNSSLSPTSNSSSATDESVTSPDETLHLPANNAHEHSQLLYHYPQHQQYQTIDKNTTRSYLKTTVKSKSLDELLYEPVDIDSNYNHKQSSHLFEMLRRENKALRRELEGYYERVSRLQKLELELQQLQDSYRLLEGASSRKAKLERAMRERLEEELLRMKQNQTQQKAELYSIKRSSNLQTITTTGQPTSPVKEQFVEKLLQQNEEAMSLREKLERNLQFTKSTLEDNESNSSCYKRRSVPEPTQQHRTKTSSKSTLDNRSELGQTYLKNLEGLQSLLTAMQTSSDNRQRLEQQLRKQLEDRVKELEAGIDSHKEQTEDQELQLARLKADKAQMEQKCAELLAEKQLAMNETRKSELRLMEHYCHTKEEEIRTIMSQRDRCMSQLEEAHKTIIKQEKRIHVLEATIKDKQFTIDSQPPPGEHNDHSKSFGSSSTKNCIISTSSGTASTSSTSSRLNHEQCVRKISSPLPPYAAGPQHPQTTLTPPTLPSYDQHLHNTMYSQYLNHTPSYCNEVITTSSSQSLPNTPETSRRRKTVSTESNPRTMRSMNLTTPIGTNGIIKSLTPPPIQHYPVKSRPPLITSHSCSVSQPYNGLPSNNLPPIVFTGSSVGKLHHQHSEHQAYHDSDSVDSLEFLLNSSSPSLSPPTRNQFANNLCTGGSYNSTTHEHSNSFPTYIQ